MHDDITGIDEHPVALRHTLDAEIAEAFRLQPLDELIGNRRNVPVGAPGSDDHLVGKGALAIEIDRGDVLGLGIIKTGEDCGE
jgi:hypothetical protein